MKGFFSLIQFSPDIARCEAINIGVIVVSEEVGFLKMRLTEDFKRVQKLLPLSSQINDAKYLESMKDAFCDLIERNREALLKKGEFERFVRTRPHEIRLTEPKSIKLDDPENDLNDLFSTLVTVTQRHEKKSSEVLFPDLDRALRMPGFSGKIQFDVTIDLPITGKCFSAPYSYRNGHVNFIKPQRFSDFSMAEQLATEGGILQKKTENRLIVIPDVAIKKPDASQHINELFALFEIQCFNGNDISPLIAQIEREAHI